MLLNWFKLASDFCGYSGSCLQNILGIQDVPHQFFLEVYYTFHKIPEARVGDVVLGLVCLALLITLMLMKSHPGSENRSVGSRFARKLVWTVATSQYSPDAGKKKT